jgi:hypothetical protein
MPFQRDFALQLGVLRALEDLRKTGQPKLTPRFASARQPRSTGGQSEHVLWKHSYPEALVLLILITPTLFQEALGMRY